MPTPYRNELDTLEARKRLLQAELESLDARIEQRRRLPLLSNAKIASPCSVQWEEMSGDSDRKRRCESCQKDVFNVSALTSEEAEQFLHENLGKNQVCVNFFFREDGTILTSDCPVGIEKKRRRTRLGLAIGALLAAAAAAVGLTLPAARPQQTLPRGVAGGL